MALTFPKFLGLNKKEIEILNCIFKFNETTLISLSGKTGIPRTTLYTHLRNLKNRGFINSIKKGKYLFITLDSAYFEAQNFTLKGVHGSGPITSFKGEDFLKKYVYYATHLSGSKRVRWIQPTYVSKKVFELTEDKDFIEMSRKIMKNQVIVESILAPDFFEAFRQFVASNKKGKEILVHYRSRPYETYMSELLNGQTAEIIIYDTFVVFSDWKTKSGFISKDANMIQMFNMHFDVLKRVSRKINPAKEFKPIFD